MYIRILKQSITHTVAYVLFTFLSLYLTTLIFSFLLYYMSMPYDMIYKGTCIVNVVECPTRCDVSKSG